MRSILLACAATLALTLPAKAADVTVAVTAIVEHPALDAARKGVLDALTAAGYKEGENLKFVFESAHCRHPGATRPPVNRLRLPNWHAAKTCASGDSRRGRVSP